MLVDVWGQRFFGGFSDPRGLIGYNGQALSFLRAYKKRLLLGSVIVIAAAVVLTTKIAVIDTPISPPPRPPLVPKRAVWSGGSDGGAWIDCRWPVSKPRSIRCTVYDDAAGSILANGRYEVRRYHNDADGSIAMESTAKPPKKLHFEGYDGDVIYLRNSLLLRQKDRGKK